MRYILIKETVIHLSVDNGEIRNAIAIWYKLLAIVFGFILETIPLKKSSNDICCRLNNSLPDAEVLYLSVSAFILEADTVHLKYSKYLD